MASTTPRRPLPALIALVALLVLTGLVWWRVLNRGTTTHHAKPCPTPTVSMRLPGQSGVTVAVLNATKRSGIASKARSTLVADGFNSPTVAGNDHKHLNKIKSVAQVRYGPKGRTGALLLHYYFPGSALVAVDSMKSATVVVSLGKSYRAVATQKAVDKALSRDKTIAGTPTPTPGSTCPSS